MYSVQIQMRTNCMTKINNTWVLFSPIIQFTIYRHKSWNERGIQSDPKGLSDVINGGGLRPSEVKRSSQSKIIKPPTADHERRLSQGVNQQECRKKIPSECFPLSSVIRPWTGASSPYGSISTHSHIESAPLANLTSCNFLRPTGFGTPGGTYFSSQVRDPIRTQKELYPSSQWLPWFPKQSVGPLG